MPLNETLTVESSGDLEARDRVESVDFYQLFDVLNDRLSEFSFAVDAPTHISIEGVAVVGSFLTADFDPQNSDMDVVVVFSEEYPDFDGFSRSVREIEQAFFDHVFYKFDGVLVKFIDIVGQIEPDGTSKREPYVKIMK
jgi:predicted nucleotidyltransferase